MSEYDSTEYDTSDDEYEYDHSLELTPQEQWDESMKQLENLFTFVVFPLIGKVLGRRFSHILWARFARKIYS